MTQVQANDALRAQVRRDLPEIQEIGDPELRDKVVEAWALSLAQEGLSSIAQIKGSGDPEKNILKEGSQIDHLRGVALLSMRMAEQLKELKPGLDIDRDVMIAGALVHDVGKAREFKEANQARWKQAPQQAGWPPARHSVHGYYICKTVDLPDEVAHIAIAHSREGVFVMKSLECTIVSHADHSYWEIMKAGGQLIDSYTPPPR